MLNELSELWRFRELLGQILARELRLRYKNSVLGFAWSVVPVLMQVIIFTWFVRGVFKLPARNYSAYALPGLLCWNFVNHAVLDSSQSILTHIGIIRKIYFPREIVPLGIILSNFVHLLLGWTIYFAIYYGVARFTGYGIPVLPGLIYFPLMLLVLFLFTTGLSLLLSAMNVFYQDVKYAAQTIFGLCTFVLPVIFPLECVYDHKFMRSHPLLIHLYELNPVVAVIDGLRKTLLEPYPAGSFNLTIPSQPMNWPIFSGAALISVFVFFWGYWYFNRLKWQFLERG